MHVPGHYSDGPCARTDRPARRSSVQLGRDTRSQPCAWTMDRHGQLPGPPHLRGPAPAASARSAAAHLHVRGQGGRSSRHPRRRHAHLAASTRTHMTNRRAHVPVPLAEHRGMWLATGAPAGVTRGPHVSTKSWEKRPERPRGSKGGGVPKRAPSACPRVVVRHAPQRAEPPPPPRSTRHPTC